MSAALGEAKAGLGDASKMQHELLRADVARRREEREVERLTAEEGRVTKTEQDLLKRLKSIMGVRIAARQRSLRKAEGAMQRMQTLMSQKESERNASRTMVLTRFKQREQALAELEASEKELEHAKKAREDAEKHYREAKMQASGALEEYRYVNSKFSGDKTKDTELKAKTDAQVKAIARMQHILSMESQRIEKAMEVQRKKLGKRRETEESKRDAEATRVKHLKQRLEAWQEEERQKTSVAAEKRAAYNDAQESYEAGRKGLLEAASQRAAKTAEDGSDWAWEDDWAHPGRGEADKLTDIDIAS